MNATNLSPVWFQSTEGRNLSVSATQDLVNQVWDAFLDGSWGNNMTYALNKTIGVRTWNFVEDDSMLQLEKRIAELQ